MRGCGLIFSCNQSTKTLKIILKQLFSVTGHLLINRGAHLEKRQVHGY